MYLSCGSLTIFVMTAHVSDKSQSVCRAHAPTRALVRSIPRVVNRTAPPTFTYRQAPSASTALRPASTSCLLLGQRTPTIGSSTLKVAAGATTRKTVLGGLAQTWARPKIGWFHPTPSFIHFECLAHIVAVVLLAQRISPRSVISKTGGAVTRSDTQ
jgi:hypothetical protein